MQPIKRTGLIYGIIAVLLFAIVTVSLAMVLLTGCAERDFDAQSNDSEEEAVITDVPDLSRGYLPVLNQDALSREMATPEGTSGGLMSHQWKVEGEVTELDEEDNIAVLSADAEDPYYRYLNNPVAFSIDSELEIAVGDRVQVIFLPPGSGETVIHPSDLTILPKAQ